jgi:hypothetical protein
MTGVKQFLVSCHSFVTTLINWFYDNTLDTQWELSGRQIGQLTCSVVDTNILEWYRLGS